MKINNGNSNCFCPPPPKTLCVCWRAPRMELDSLDIGLYVEDDEADLIVSAALEAEWAPRFRKPRGALLEVVFLPDKASQMPDTHCTSEEVLAGAAATRHGLPPSSSSSALSLPPELSIVPFLSVEQAGPTLAEHLARTHPFTDRTLARFGMCTDESETHARNGSVPVLYGWLEPMPQSCLIQYAETVEDDDGLSREEEATLAQHLLPDPARPTEESTNTQTHNSAAEQAGVPMTAPSPDVMGAPSASSLSPCASATTAEKVGGMAPPPGSASRTTATPPTPTTKETVHAEDAPVFHIVRGELHFRLHLWSTPHMTRALQQHDVDPAAQTLSTAAAANSKITTRHDQMDEEGLSAMMRAAGNVTTGSGRLASEPAGVNAPLPPPPLAEELTWRDDTAMVKNALETVVKMSQMAATHANATVQVFTDSAPNGDTEYVVFEDN